MCSRAAAESGVGPRASLALLCLWSTSSVLQHGSPPVPCSGSRARQACSAHQFCSPSTRNKLPHPQLVNKYARHPRAFLDAFAAAYLKMASMNAVWQPYK